MGQVTLGSDKGAVLLPVRVKPRARANVVEGVRNDALLVSVTAAPAAGAANAAVIEVIAQALNCPRSALAIARGHKSRDKLIRIEHLSGEEVSARLDALDLVS
jgi:uncharacterized protein YggU (UPF0235/DUF167 family)